MAMPRGPDRPAPAWANLSDADVDAILAKLERRPATVSGEPGRSSHGAGQDGAGVLPGHRPLQ